jgi:hypothetical protein
LQELALFSTTSYNWTAGKSKTTWHVLDVASGDVTDAPIDADATEIVWVGATNTSVLYINGTNEEVPGGVTLYTADLGEDEFTPYVGIRETSKCKLTLPANSSDL